jgi:hypothetical protein
VILLMLAGCGSYFMPDRNISDALPSTQIVGTWVLTGKSLELLKRDGYADSGKPHQIVFHADGRCDYSSVEFGPPKSSHETRAGTWMLLQNVPESGGTKANEVSMTFKEPGITRGEALNIARENGALILWKFYGDPDSWEFIEYRREQP